MLIVDDERNKISIPLVRPENDSAFKALSTGPEPCPTVCAEQDGQKETDPLQINGGQPSEAAEDQRGASPRQKSTAPNLTLRTSSDSFGSHHKPRSAQFATDSEDNSPDQPQLRSTASDRSISASGQTEASGVWGSWRRDSNTGKSDSTSHLSAYQRPTRPRSMKVLKPTKSSSSSRQVSSTTNASSVQEAASSRTSDPGHRGRQSPSADSGESPETTPNHPKSAKSGDGPWASKPHSVNPIGGASAFGWLNTNQRGKA
jgi:hypothetical protein